MTRAWILPLLVVAACSVTQSNLKMGRGLLEQARTDGAEQCAAGLVTQAEDVIAACEKEPNEACSEDSLSAGAAVARYVEDNCAPSEAPRPQTAAPVETKDPERATTIFDVDGDGVKDVDDQCPQLPGVLERGGCPAGDDSDGDGVDDNADACPDVPEDLDGFADQDGCPDTDHDEDGIQNVNDKCPDTPGKPEFAGCPSKDTIPANKPHAN